MTEANHDYDEFQSRLQSAIVGPTKKAMSLPKDIQFFRSLDQEFNQDLDACTSRLLSFTNRIFEWISNSDVSKSRKNNGKAKLHALEDVSDGFRSLVVHTMDLMLERTDTYLDEFAGRSNKTTSLAVNGDISAKSLGRHLHPDLYHAASLAKPQLKFRTPPDNANDIPWRPPLKQKYNALVPLDENSASTPAQDVLDVSPHPYEHEVLNRSYPQTMFEQKPAQEPLSFDETPFQWIATEDDLASLVDDLANVTELAIDLEHHDYRTFAGFLCLMQVSTRQKDYIIDTLVLRDELGVLNQVFTNPHVVKVFHGAESDIIWLQQNFQLYIVNLFDTYHATNVLNFRKHSLASLLTLYCDFVADKKYQLADWRIRPLPDEMLHYARSDTHFLLYIYDQLRNTLIENAEGRPELVHEVLRRSEDTALRMYEKEIYDFENGTGRNGWANLLLKWNTGLSELQKEVMKSIHRWRDSVARSEDESIRYVMPNNQLFKLAGQPPADMTSLRSILKNPSPPVRTRLPDLLAAIRQAVTAELAKPPQIVLNPEKPSNPVVPIASSPLWELKLDSHHSSSHSQLYGDSISEPYLQYVATRSSLFSDLADRPAAHLARVEFQTIVGQIHESIRQAPTAQKEKQMSPQDLTPALPLTSVPAIENETKVSQALEIAFIPASQRQTTQVEVDNDIVVVGKSRKRKRRAAVAASSTQESSSSQVKVVQEQVSTQDLDSNLGVAISPPTTEIFDYDGAPNILDHLPNVAPEEAQPRKRRRQKKPNAIDYGSFPAPPKNKSEVRKGNISKTFR